MYYLTADGGTESLRARIYDLTGRCLGQKAVAYDTRFGPGARAEQDPEDWWRADRKSTLLNSSHTATSRMPSSA